VASKELSPSDLSIAHGERQALIRMVKPRDVEAVVELVRETLAEFGLCFGEGATTDAELLRLPGAYVDRGGAFFVAVSADEAESLLGTCGVFPVAEATFELRKMYLKKEARGLGLGQRLFDEALAFTRQRGGRRMVLDTVEAMTRAIAFYEANGFVRDDAEIRGARCSRGYARNI
jgi:putative acetyltransferase